MIMTEYEKYKKQLREQAQRMLVADLERIKNLEKPHDVRFAYKVPTNADRIRAMSDEELVEHFWEIMPDEKFCTGICNDQHDCNVCRLAWLRQPAEVE
jgi:uncharacterized protein YegJ (DUF2314 family)